MNEYDNDSFELEDYEYICSQMKITATQFRVQKLEAAYNAIEFLETAGVLFYGAEACAIEDATTAIRKALEKALFEDFEAELAEECSDDV